MLNKSIKTTVSTLILGLGLTVMGQANASQAQADAFNKLDYKQAIEQAHQWFHTGKAMISVVGHDIKAKFPDGSIGHVAIPKSLFYVSIAPFINQTHGCTYHMPTGCTGELQHQTMHVTATDLDSGKLVINKDVTTQKDGFMDFWLPSQHRFKFTISYTDAKGQKRIATEQLSSFDESRTCVTTMRLLLADA